MEEMRLAARFYGCAQRCGESERALALSAPARRGQRRKHRNIGCWLALLSPPTYVTRTRFPYDLSRRMREES